MALTVSKGTQEIIDAIAEVEQGARRILVEAGWTDDELAVAWQAREPGWAYEVARCSWSYILNERKPVAVTRAVVAMLARARGDADVAGAAQVVVGLGGGKAVVEYAVGLAGGVGR